MPTPEQLSKIWESELEFPSIRREDDPMYVPPEKFKQYHENKKSEMSNESKQSSPIGVEQAAKEFSEKEWPILSEEDYYKRGNDEPYYDYSATSQVIQFAIKKGFISGSQWASPLPNCEANHLDINELLAEFNRRGFNTENWDGDEGAEKAIVDGVCNYLEERQEKLFDTITEQHIEINKLRNSHPTAVNGDDESRALIEKFISFISNQNAVFCKTQYGEFWQLSGKYLTQSNDQFIYNFFKQVR